jgi:hypothetical protein
MGLVDSPTQQESTMFWFQHPRPPSRKEVAEQVVMRKQAVPDVRLLIVDTTPAKAVDTVLPSAPQHEKD